MENDKLSKRKINRLKDWNCSADGDVLHTGRRIILENGIILTPTLYNGWIMNILLKKL